MVLGMQRGKLSRIAVAVMVAGAAMVLAGPGWASAGPNPPGNNGTIKLDATPFDDHPNNQPHLGCVFQVDFYGYDEGDLDATVTFQAHPPTQRPGDDQVLLTDTVFIGEDDNAGGGSEAGLDASVTYTLDFTGIEPHPVQGFHVKLTINAEGSRGADVKHKVFWVTGCPPAPTTTTTTSSTSTSTSRATTTSGETTTSKATTTSHEATTTTSAVGDSSSSAPGGPTGGGELPFTGAGSLPMPFAAIVLLGLGAASLFAGSRGRRRT
jgi:hypothetical protein